MTSNSTTRDVSGDTDIASAHRMNGPDGAFDRKPSTFRNFIEKDGQFAPEEGMWVF